jgi:hypothetical protein
MVYSKKKFLNSSHITLKAYKDNIKVNFRTLVPRSSKVIKNLMSSSWDCRCVNNGALPRLFVTFTTEWKRNQNLAE